MKLNSTINQVITNYINAPKTDYAILINGPWGCGKTYHIRNNVFPVIKGIDSQRKKGKESTEKYKFIPLYISLYGLSSIGEIHTRILQERFTFLKGKLGLIVNSGVNLLTSKIGFDKAQTKELNSFANIESNYVLFFDDLERINTDAVSIKSVLGHINTYTEHQNLKVIIISNDDKQSVEHYQEFKEKTIRFTNTFKADISKVFDTMCASKEEPYRRYICSQKDYILNIFSYAKCQNLRTLKFLIDIFEEVHKKINGKEYAELILRKLLLFTTIYTIEYKNGATQEQLETLKELHTYRYKQSLSALVSATSNKEPHIDESEDIIEYRKECYAKYNTFETEYKYISEITSLIQQGYLCADDITETIIVIHKELVDMFETEPGKLLCRIVNWEKIEDHEFLSVIVQILQHVNSGDYNIANLLKIYARLVNFQCMEIEGFKISSKITQDFKKAIDKAQKKHKYNRAFTGGMPIWRAEDELGFPVYDKMYQYALAANEAVGKKEKQGEREEFLSLIKNNKYEEFHKAVFLDKSICLQEIPLEQLMPIIYAANQHTKHTFSTLVHSLYPKRKYALDEVEYLTALSQSIEKFLESQKPLKLSSAYLIELKNHIKDVLGFNDRK